MRKLSLFTQSSFVAYGCFILLGKTIVSIINRTIHVHVLELPAADLFLVLHMISHSFAAVTREISHLEINLVFPHDNLGSKGGASG